MRFHILDSSMNKIAVSAVIGCNKVSSVFGLSLTPVQAAELVETRSKALKDAGRIEFGGGIIEKLVFEFCDSVYIQQSDYADIMNEMVEMFYQFKNAVRDRLNDEELIQFMRDAFDRCEGSIELVEGRELERLLEKLEEEK